MTTIRCPLYEAACISRHEKALVGPDVELLYHELDELASRVAKNLQERGLREGDRVATFLPQDWRYVAIAFGVWRAGMILCPLNTRLPRAAAVRQIRQVGARLVLAYLKAGAAEDLAGIDVAEPAEVMVYSDLGSLDVERRMEVDRIATLVFTSGSSGEPKPAALTYGNHYYSARGSNLNLHVGSFDRWLLQLPMYHVGGLGVLHRCMLGGATIVLPKQDQPLADAVATLGVTHLSIVATQLRHLLATEPAPGLGKLKAILLGGGPVSAPDVREARRRGWPVYASYGLTEMASQVCTMKPDSPPSKQTSSGCLLKHRELRISTGGEIEVRGATRFAGYWEPDGTVSVPFSAGGWFATGDLGQIDGEGYLTVLGRRDNLIISGGENIQPEEIERAIAVMPEVEDVIVVGMPSERFGARPLAFVRWRGGAVASAEMRERLGRVLPAFKIPDLFHAWPESVEAGKQARRELAVLAGAGS